MASAMGIWNSEVRFDCDGEVETFAQRTLEEAAAQNAEADESGATSDDGGGGGLGVHVDDNLGAYVTRSLREGLKSAEELANSQLLESLTELLQDQCYFTSSETAAVILEQIAQAVFTQRSGLRPSSLALSAARNSESSTTDTSVSSYYAQMSIGISPLAAQSLLPGALLEEEEDDDDDDEYWEDQLPHTVDETAFPPLGVQTDEFNSTSKHNHLYNTPHLPHHGTKHRKSDSASKAVTVEASELAAALFRPTTRSRQSSIDATNSSDGTANQSNHVLSHTAAQQQQHQMTLMDEYEMMQMQNSTEIILQLNGSEISHDAAYAAVVLTSGDVNAAQYILEQVQSELPVCRHLLQDGRCYRADCSYGHDVENHTCLFWLKSRCGKGTACRFLHGIAPKWIQNLPDQVPQYYDYSNEPTVTYDESVYSKYGESIGDYTTLSTQQSYSAIHSSSWIPSKVGVTSFANIASQGYSDRQSFVDYNDSANAASQPVDSRSLATVKIPLELWNSHENRDSSAFYIVDPLQRYYTVAATSVGASENVIDLHFQSLQTFGAVLDVILPEKLRSFFQVWIVTGTGHHVGSRTHQKGSGALEAAVVDYLLEYFPPPVYEIKRGRDRNGLGGAILVELQRQYRHPTR